MDPCPIPEPAKHIHRPSDPADASSRDGQGQRAGDRSPTPDLGSAGLDQGPSLPAGRVAPSHIKLGAALLTLSIDARGELGPAYLVVLGLEAVLALAFGAMLFGEHPNIGRLFGLGLLVVGMNPHRNGFRIGVIRRTARSRGR